LPRKYLLENIYIHIYPSKTDDLLSVNGTEIIIPLPVPIHNRRQAIVNALI
jgi:hypothetical protein